MVKKSYIPDRGDVVWVDLNPTLGHEQKNRRPVLVLSPKSYNQKSSLIIACPFTTAIKGYPFEVVMQHEGLESAILADQVRALDWRVRNVEFYFRSTSAALREVQEKISLLIL